MSDEPDSIVLRYLRRIDARLDDMVGEMREIKARVASLEEQFVVIRSDIANIHGDIVRLDHRIDRVEVRLERMEKRLDLIAA